MMAIVVFLFIAHIGLVAITEDIIYETQELN